MDRAALCLAVASAEGADNIDEAALAASMQQLEQRPGRWLARHGQALNGEQLEAFDNVQDVDAKAVLKEIRRLQELNRNPAVVRNRYVVLICLWRVLLKKCIFVPFFCIFFFVR